MRKRVIAIVGPTASGKTDIAVKLAKELNGEIISADSRLVYEDFNIGTAKPSLEEREGVPHYLIDVENPKNTYSASNYKQDAEEAIQEVLNKGKVPIIAGGTGFYVKTLLDGLDIPAVEPDEKFRKEMYGLAAEKGKEEVYKLLQDADPVAAEKIHPHNLPRMVRALEVCKISGRPMSEMQTISEPKYDVLYVGLTASDREYLYERINRRVLQMLEMGLVEEVEGLIKKYGKTTSMLKTLGYREICDYLDGNCSLDEAVELIQKNTRNFAKRQLTWFRGNERINWFYIDRENAEDIVKKILLLAS